MDDSTMRFEDYLPPVDWERARKLEIARKMRDASAAMLRSHCLYTCTTCTRISEGVYDLCSEAEYVDRQKTDWALCVSALEQNTQTIVPPAFYSAFSEDTP